VRGPDAVRWRVVCWGGRVGGVVNGVCFVRGCTYLVDGGLLPFYYQHSVEHFFERAIGIILDSRRPLSSVFPLEVFWDGVRRKAEAVSRSSHRIDQAAISIPNSIMKAQNRIRSMLSGLTSHDEGREDRKEMQVDIPQRPPLESVRYLTLGESLLRFYYTYSKANSNAFPIR
jgi:hypothetical protein